MFALIPEPSGAVADCLRPFVFAVRRGKWLVPYARWTACRGSSDGSARVVAGDITARLRLSVCAGCEERVEGWHCGVMRERVTCCSSCVRMSYGGGKCPRGWWPAAPRQPLSAPPAAAMR